MFFIFFLLNSFDKKFVSQIKNITGLKVKNIDLYKLAFQHKKSDGSFFSNERLEFLGDAALSLAVADFLFKKYPQKDEGFLTDIRSRLVSRNTLDDIAMKMGLMSLLVHDSSDKRSRHVLGNTLEAFLGAIYLDSGYNNFYNFVVNKLLRYYVDLEYVILNNLNFKSLLFEWSNKTHHSIEFEFCKTKEIDNKNVFFINVLLDSQILSCGEGLNKKEAEQNAARLALGIINLKKIAKLNPETNFINGELTTKDE